MSSRPLDGKVAIVTGAGSGIGQAIAMSFATAGAKVVICGRRRNRIEAAAAEIASARGAAIAVIADISKEEDVAALFRAALDKYGRVDMLVNNAGTSNHSDTDKLSLADWQKVIDTNLTGAFLCSREAFRLMKPQRSGRIINIGSTSAKVPRKGSAAYGASKFGLDGLTRALAIEGREFGIAVSVIHPGNTIPGLWTGMEEKARKEGLMQADSVARVALVMATMPADVNLYESLILPVTMPFLGRG
jgi:NAD(P)-dependent dehydrogenase (short-subunit alcohol dehydrogenase family)